MIEQYNIKKLFSDYTLFVPEIQRDYVWGATENCQKVMIPFLEALNSNLQGEQNYNIGFLYSYTNSPEDNYIIDGQQRFTTIVLLLYVLSVREGKDFNAYIGTNKPIMHFSYNVRPQTEVFMRNLFLSKTIEKNYIVNQTWFLSEYVHDITINSMVNAVDTLNKKLDNLANISYEKVLNQVCFWYFNVDETSQGEELYIKMNSRGQKLTEAEQIKPYLFNEWQKKKSTTYDNTDYGKKWDEWEELFYSKKGELSIISVDCAMNTFLRIVYEMETLKECNGEIPHRTTVLNLPKIAKYMAIMLEYAEREWPQLLTGKIKYRPHRVLKALIAEGLKPKHHNRDLERVEKIFTNIVTRRKYRLSHGDILEFLSEYSKSSNSFYDFITENPRLSELVFDKHELKKIAIYKQFEKDVALQTTIENIFWEAETRKVWRGNISPLIKWSFSEDDSPESFSLTAFKTYLSKFDELFGDNKLKNKDMDITRRALIANELHDYPKIFRGYTNSCFAYEDEDWHVLFLDEENIPKMKQFFDQYTGKESLYKMISCFPIEKEYSEFVHIPELLDFCKHKNFQWWHDCIYLIEGKTANGHYANIHSYKYYLSRKNHLLFPGWTKMNFWSKDGSCIYLDQNTEDNTHIAIDAYWNGGLKNDQMAIEVHIRNSEPNRTEAYLSSITTLSNYKWNGERYVYYLNAPKEEAEAFLLMDKELTFIITIIEQLKL